MRIRLVSILTVCLISPAVVTTAEGTNRAKLIYPETRRVDQIDEYFGVKVPDPYRWLEADIRESSEVADWAKKQNDVARKYLDAIPQRAAIKKRLTELQNIESYWLPTQKGGKYFFTKSDGLNENVLYVADSYKSEGRVLVDPNKWSTDGSIEMTQYSLSDDGQLLAYARSEAGSDWNQIYVVDVATGKAIDEPLTWTRAHIAWAKDGSGFYYRRYPEPPQGLAYQALVLNAMVSFHKLGTKQADDKVVYFRPDHPDWRFNIETTHDGKYLVLHIGRGSDNKNQVLVRDASAPLDAPFKELIGDFKNQFRFMGNEGTKFFYLTDLDAPTKRVVTMDIEHPGREYAAEVVPAGKATLDDANILSGRVICHYMVDVLSQVEVFDLSGKPLGKVELPGKGTAMGFWGNQSDKETFFCFDSYNRPGSIYRYDVLAGTVELVHQPRVKVDPDEFVVEQVFYKSKDGTRVPMTLVYRKRLAKDRPHPTLLYGYGGFNVSLLPGFNFEYIVWMELGGVVAVPNLRGGGEYGEEWHLAGKTVKKQNVFDDFIAAAEWLIREKRTTPDKLAILGGSNGGLLVGAVEVQRPELFGACVPRFGVMDMIRRPAFTSAQDASDEYGHIEKEDEFKALLAYSPYHNIKAGTHFPPTLS